MAAMKELCVVIQYTQNDNEEAVKQIYDCIITQKHHPFKAKVVFWCTSNRLQAIIEHVDNTVQRPSTNVVESNATFLCDISTALEAIGYAEYILICSCHAILNSKCFSFLAEKTSEYGDSTVLSSCGIRIFPHNKVENPHLLKEGVQWKYYSSAQPDRAVHFFTTDFCFISAQNLNLILANVSDSTRSLSSLNTLLCSFILGCHVQVPIWKIQTNDYVYFDKEGVNRHFFPDLADLQKSNHIHKLYSLFFENNWPNSISHPFHCPEKLSHVKQDKVLPHEIWQKGFGGVNMPCEPATELDFTAAAAYGIRVIRIGALCDAKDLAFLLDPNASSVEEDRKHFLQALPRLKKNISTAGANGLKVIITMADLPGCKFHTQPTSSPFPFWDSSQCRTRAAKFWGLMAESLQDMSSVIMAYDVINEPYTPEDKNVGFFGDMPLGYAATLLQFYEETLKEIREHDKNVIVIIKSTWFSNPRTFEILQPFSDPHVVYAFHMYAPDTLALYRAFGTPCFSYPGKIPREISNPSDKIEVTREYLQQLLENSVHNWQVKHQIPSRNILVAEFGICREVLGAEQYLEDLVSIFHHFQWSWLLFSFRDEEWDALDYELGTDMDNMLNRSATKLFLTVAKHFH